MELRNLFIFDSKRDYMRICISIALCLLYSFTACAQKAETSLAKLDWLAGNWKGMYKGAPFYEAWRKVNDTVMVNFAIEIKVNDTLVKEQGFIALKQGRILHGNKETTWDLDWLDKNSVVFKNDLLKYANKITWTHSKNDHWLAEIKNPGGILNYDLERIAWLDKAIDSFISQHVGGR